MFSARLASFWCVKVEHFIIVGLIRVLVLAIESLALNHHFILELLLAVVAADRPVLFTKSSFLVNFEFHF